MSEEPTSAQERSRRRHEAKPDPADPAGKLTTTFARTDGQSPRTIPASRFSLQSPDLILINYDYTAIVLVYHAGHVYSLVNPRRGCHFIPLGESCPWCPFRGSPGVTLANGSDLAYEWLTSNG